MAIASISPLVEALFSIPTMAHVTLNEEDAFRQSLIIRRIVNSSQKLLDKALAEDARSHVIGDFLSEPEQFQTAVKSQAVKGPQALVRHTARALDSLAFLAKCMNIDSEEAPPGAPPTSDVENADGGTGVFAGIV